jgi:iron complex transport system substrate-binding protein
VKKAVLVLLPLLVLPAPRLRAACITDDTGVEVCLNGAPQRAVSLYGAFTETLSALGAAGTLVARTKNDDTIPEVAKLPSVGTGLRPNVEYLLALRPELILSRSGRAASEALTALRARGLRVAAFDPTGLDELYATIERLGTLWDRKHAARGLADRLRAAVADVERHSARAGRRPTVVYEVRAEPLTVAGTGGLVDELIRVAGGENAVASPKKLLAFDPEALLRLDPDVYLVQEGPMNPNPLPPGKRPLFQTLKAVREGRVMIVDEELFARPSPRVAEAAERLSRFLHPDLWSTPPPQPARKEKP